jgi:hypothetical protein
MNTASNTRLWLTTQVGQDHAATGVLLALGINNQLHRPQNAAEHKPRGSLTYTGQVGEHHRSDRFCWWNLEISTEQLLHRSGWCSSLVRPVQARKPQIYQTVLSSSKLTQTRKSSNTGQQRTHSNVHTSKNPTGVCTGQTGERHRSDQWEAPVRPVCPGLLGWTAPAGQLRQIQLPISRIAPRICAKLWG